MRGYGWVLREGRGRIRALWRARRTDLLVAGRGGLEVGGYQAITSTYPLLALYFPLLRTNRADRGSV